MTIAQIEQTEQGTIVKLHDNREVARMFLTADDRDTRKLCLEIKDTGEATMDLVLAVFKYARAMGELPIIE
jgi:hypothetical protein